MYSGQGAGKGGPPFSPNVRPPPPPPQQPPTLRIPSGTHTCTGEAAVVLFVTFHQSAEGLLVLIRGPHHCTGARSKGGFASGGRGWSAPTTPPLLCAIGESRCTMYRTHRSVSQSTNFVHGTLIFVYRNLNFYFVKSVHGQKKWKPFFVWSLQILPFVLTFRRKKSEKPFFFAFPLHLFDRKFGGLHGCCHSSRHLNRCCQFPDDPAWRQLPLGGHWMDAVNVWRPLDGRPWLEVGSFAALALAGRTAAAI